MEPAAAADGAACMTVAPQYDGQNTKNPPPVLPDASSSLGKNILLSEIEKL
jgi:hypothetical protein